MSKLFNPTLSVIAADMRLEGAISIGGILKVEGTIVGDVHSEHQVLVATGGSILGNVTAPEAVVDGNIQGSIKSTRRVELRSNAVVHGDITTGQILVHEGGRVDGRLRMKTDEDCGTRSTGA